MIKSKICLLSSGSTHTPTLECMLYDPSKVDCNERGEQTHCAILRALPLRVLNIDHV